jgi:hypothetical protein
MGDRNLKAGLDSTVFNGKEFPFKDHARDYVIWSGMWLFKKV